MGEYEELDEVDGSFGLIDLLRVGLGVVLALQVVWLLVSGHWWWNNLESKEVKLNSEYWSQHGYTIPHAFSLEELALFSGASQLVLDSDGISRPNPILLAINGTVFDVSSSPRFYGPWGPYKKFTGTDCSNNFQYGMFDFNAYGTPCHWDISSLNEEQTQKVREWVSFFESKYPIVGTVILPGRYTFTSHATHTI